MSKIALLLTTLSLMLLVLSPSNSMAQDESWAARIAERYSASVVEIEVETPTGSGSGSGFFVDTVGTIATNLHVVLSGTAVRVRMLSGEEFNVVGFYNFDADRDLILLRVPVITTL